MIIYRVDQGDSSAEIAVFLGHFPSSRAFHNCVCVCVCVCVLFREPFYHFIPSLVAIVRGIKLLMRIGFLYYNCLGFDLASDYTDIIPNTACIGSTEQTGSFHLVTELYLY